MQNAADTLLFYAFRGPLFRPERRFTLMPEGLLVQSGQRRDLIPYGDATSVQMHQVDIRAIGPVDRCILRARGRSIRLQSAHVAGPAHLQDRRTSYEPFVWQLALRIMQANPEARVMVGTPWSTRLGWALTLLTLMAAAVGGLALLFAGAWSGVWLIVTALAALPAVIGMLNRAPSRQLAPSAVTGSSSYSDLLAR